VGPALTLSLEKVISFGDRWLFGYGTVVGRNWQRKNTCPHVSSFCLTQIQHGLASNQTWAV
jgi:precorrin-6B methylase 1